MMIDIKWIGIKGPLDLHAKQTLGIRQTLDPGISDSTPDDSYFDTSSVLNV